MFDPSGPGAKGRAELLKGVTKLVKTSVEGLSEDLKALDGGAGNGGDQLRFLRVRTKRFEIMVTPNDKYLLVVLQVCTSPFREVLIPGEEEEADILALYTILPFVRAVRIRMLLHNSKLLPQPPCPFFRPAFDVPYTPAVLTPAILALALTLCPSARPILAAAS